MWELLLSKGLRRDRAALLLHGRLQRFDFQRRGNESLIGAIFMGRINKIIRNGAFIDLGSGDSAYLTLSDGHGYHEGAAIPVRVIRDGYHDKGPALSAEINIAGRYLVGLLNSQDLRFSKQIAAGQRTQLSSSLNPLSDAGFGAILRRTAAQAKPDEIHAEAARLSGALHALQKALAAAKAPQQLHPALPFFDRIIQDWPLASDVRVEVDHSDLQVRCGAHGLPAVLARDGEKLFQVRSIEEQIASLLQPTALLPSGGEIIIEETQALNTVDVNSAAHSGAGDAAHRALAVNLEAADEIGRQVQLRQMGGHFVVDFLRLKAKPAQSQLLRRLRKAITAGGGHGRVAGPSEFGLYEFTLPRQGESLAERLASPCPLCGGRHQGGDAAEIGDQILEQLASEARARKVGRLTLRAAGRVIDAISSDLDLLSISVKLIKEDSFMLEQYEILDG